MTMHILQDHPYALSLCPKCPHSFVTLLGSPELDLRLDDGYVPCAPTETAALSASLFQVQDSIDRCDLEITRVESTLRRLRGVKTSLQFTSDKIQSLLSPIRRIPPEILAEIAAYTLPPGWFEGYVGQHVWTFSQVCHTWRATAIHMRWPWAYIRVPAWSFEMLDARHDGLMDALMAYLRYSGQHPLKIVVAVSRSDLKDILNAHSERIYELDIGWRCCVPSQLSALRRLSVRGGPHHPINAPNLRVLSLHSSHSTNITLPWDNLRGLSVRNWAIDNEDFNALRHCARLEVLILAAFVDEQEPEGTQEAIVFPVLHTLEIGSAAVTLCAYLCTPALRHLVLNVPTKTFHVNIDAEAFGYLYPLVPRITTLTLYDMDKYNYQVPYLRELFSEASQLRKIIAIVTQPATEADDIFMYTKLFHTLCCSDGQPELPQLMEVEFLEKVESIGWNDERVDLVRRLLQSRGAPSIPGPARLKRLQIRSPFVFPDSAVAEDWANFRWLDGERILDVDMQCIEEEGLVESGIDVAAALGDLR
ncbi:hypothetical protein GGF50DRAFT_112539 [Schizophyllum commune]